MSTREEKLAALRRSAEDTSGEKHLLSTQGEERQKPGPKSTKDPAIEYVKVTNRIPKDLRERLKLALLTTHKVYGTADEMIRVLLERELRDGPTTSPGEYPQGPSGDDR